MAMLLFKLLTPYRTQKEVITSAHMDMGRLGKGQENLLLQEAASMFRSLNQDLNMVKIPTAQEHQAWTQVSKHVNKHKQSTLLPASFSLSLWIYSLLCEKACLKDFSSHPLPSPSVFHLTALCKEVSHKTQPFIGTAASTKLV